MIVPTSYVCEKFRIRSWLTWTFYVVRIKVSYHSYSTCFYYGYIIVILILAILVRLIIVILIYYRYIIIMLRKSLWS